MLENITYFVVGGLIGAFISFVVFSGLLSGPETDARVEGVAKHQRVDSVASTPALGPSTRTPEYVVRWRVQRDTVEVCYNVPDDLPTEGTVIARENSVDIRRPIFRDPYVTYRYFDPVSFEAREQRYVVKPDPWRYGIEAATYTGSDTGIEAGGYLGYQNVTVFARGRFEDLKPGYHFGVRLRFGR